MEAPKGTVETRNGLRFVPDNFQDTLASVLALIAR